MIGDKAPLPWRIATRSTGFDHIDLQHCEANNITVCNVPVYGDNTVAEHVFALLLAISHTLHVPSNEKTRNLISDKEFARMKEGVVLINTARGDLGVQIPLQDVPAVQKRLIHQANLLGRPVITATQKLVSMTENIRPTRAEVSDVANAILDGTDAVMLSEETAIGRYPVEAVEMISKIAISAEREKKAIRALADLPACFRAAVGSGNAAVEDVVTLKAVESADTLHVRYILTHTQGRAAPCLISRFRPDCWILAHGGDEKTNNFLALFYGVLPVHLDGATTGLADKAVRWLVTAGMVEKDESLIGVEDESSDDRREALSMKIIKA